MWTKAKALQLDLATMKWSCASSGSSILQKKKETMIHLKSSTDSYHLVVPMLFFGGTERLCGQLTALQNLGLLSVGFMM